MNILKITRLITLFVLLMMGATLSERAVAQPGVSVPIEAFYDELAPYGQWLQYPAYGYVWLPNAGPNFQPYVTAGHWIMTDYGNTWVSDYPWGWAAFHYGRWIFDSAYGGWLWIPGSDWAPAWVDWRAGSGYYGWAPLGPGWGSNVTIPAPFWTFVPEIYITSPYIYNYCVPRPSVVNIYQRTTIINNVYRSNNWAYNYGPPRRDIERITRRPVQVYRIDRMDRPGRAVVGNGSVGFYQPGPGAVRRDGPGYGRNDRFDNSGPNYGGNVPSSRGGYNGNNNPPSPNNNMANPSRGSYGSNTPANPGGSYSPQSVPGNQPSNRWDNSRFNNGRGSFSPGNAQPQMSSPNTAPQQPGRSFERMERAGSMSQPTQPSTPSGGSQHAEGRMGSGQTQAPSQLPGARSGNGNSNSTPFGGERGGRGPR